MVDDGWKSLGVDDQGPKITSFDTFEPVANAVIKD